jgi:hypothetical protein
MTRTSTWIAAAALVSLGGCGGTQLDPNPAGGEFKSQINLAPLLPANADLVGIAVSPEGKRYVLDRNSGLYELGVGAARFVYDTPDSLEVTDVVALGSDRFAVTAVNDGYMLDLHNQTFSSYFCYLPGDLPADPSGTPTVIPSVSQMLRSQGIEVQERTESVAFNPLTLQLFAQPQTIIVDTGEVAGSELFTFAEAGGQPIAVITMPELRFIAGGMAAVDGVRLLLGRGNAIYEMTGGPTPGPSMVKQLADGTIDISGLALDADGDLLLLDRAGRRLLEM